jgi:FeS assembly SUF system regulator
VIRLSNLADYAVVVMTAAAKCNDPRLSAAAVAAHTGISAPTVAKLMGTLARAGLLVSTRGVAGGFHLARAASAISVAAIVEAVDGPIALTNCQHGEVSSCALTGSCAVRPHWGAINGAVRDALTAVTLADLLQPTAARVSA